MFMRYIIQIAKKIRIVKDLLVILVDDCMGVCEDEEAFSFLLDVNIDLALLKLEMDSDDAFR